MPAEKLTPTPRSYAQLRDAVLAVVVKGREEIDRAWLGTYYETGRLIQEHILLFRDRANYGAKTFHRLAEDTGVNIRTLRECVQFYRHFPIRRARAELGWTHYRLIAQVDDDIQRKAIEAETIRRKWTSRELEIRVRALNAAAAETTDQPAAAPVELLTPRRGTPGLHPIVDRGNGPVVDLGFRLYRELGRNNKLTPGDIVRLDDAGVRRAEGATKAELFTYAATVRCVIDGDTLLVALTVAPGFTHELRLRLRGLDCPELATAAGRAAKRFVDARLGPGDPVVVSTTKPDKYDRYLADVFVGKAVGGKLEAESLIPNADGCTFLNNALLEAGHAVRYDGEAKE